MDYDDFRAILDSSGVDVWTFIDTAIAVASMDYGGELRQRRDGIVERLYAASSSSSASDHHRPRHYDREAKTAGEKERVSPPTPQSIDRENSDNDGEGLDPYGGLFDDEQKKILEIKEQLEDSDQSEDTLVELLQSLADMDITFQALKETDIGRHVNRLRKHPSSEVKRLVKQVVRKWKDTVDEWVKLNQPGEHASNSLMDGDSPQQKIPQNGHHQVPDFAYSPNPHNGSSGSDKNNSEPERKPKAVPSRREALPKPTNPSVPQSAHSTPQNDKTTDNNRITQHTLTHTHTHTRLCCYMAKPNFPEKQTISTTTTWGTWEELLLACAVHRYGADSWDSVSSELRKRTSTLHLLTPHSCKQKYHDLRRRFTQNAVVSSATADGAATANAAVASIPFLDELRRLRVAELRREVERYDLSIVSLESKVEKLKEEREQSLKETDETAEKADLEKEDRETKPENWSHENIAEKAVSGEGSVHDERSVDESNSTNLKDDAPETGGAAAEKEPERARACGKPAVEDSYDGSSETIAKGSAAVSPVEESEKVNSEKDGGGESAESKGGEEGAKEVCSSEMQSSTSLSRKKVEEPDEPDAEDQSVATKRAHHVESKSLADFLEILRSHRSGSFFEHRLEIQDTTNYINMIRQHIDFEMVRIRLEEGWYSSCRSKFFRDVLLILNNAIVFFGRKSPESKAALELRLLVLKETAQRSAKEDSLPKEEAQAPKPEPEETDMLLRKPKLSVPMNACRKRSSITARAASTSSSGPERKKEQTQTSALLDVKPAMSWKQSDKSSDKAEELPSTKKRRKERLRAGAKNNSSNKSSVSRSNAENNKNSGANSNASPSTKGGTSNEISISKSDKKNNNSNASGKKQSAANFLNRMKRGSSSSNRSLLETLKDSDKSSRGRAEQKKSGGNKGNSKQKEQTSTRKASGGKQAKEHESPSKRSVGRPSKRAAAAAVPAKRSRQSVETEVTAARNAKKRRK